jgi:hypothetical protein
MGLNPKALELSKIAQEWSDSEVHWIIRNGIRMTGMPAVGGTHDEREIRGLVAVIRAMAGLSPEEYGQLAKSLAETPHHWKPMESNETGAGAQLRDGT